MEREHIQKIFLKEGYLLKQEIAEIKDYFKSKGLQEISRELIYNLIAEDLFKEVEYREIELTTHNRYITSKIPLKIRKRITKFLSKNCVETTEGTIKYTILDKDNTKATIIKRREEKAVKFYKLL